MIPPERFPRFSIRTMLHQAKAHLRTSRACDVTAGLATALAALAEHLQERTRMHAVL